MVQPRADHHRSRVAKKICLGPKTGIETDRVVLDRFANTGHLPGHQLRGKIRSYTIIPAIDTIEVSDMDTSLLGHGYFVEARDLLHANLEGKPPPRFGLLPIQTIEGQAY